jgi:nucleotide-binding universal stress UspA family protein
MFANVVVGVDGAEGGRDALALARWLLDSQGQLTFAHVFGGEPHTWRGVSRPYNKEQVERARELLARVREESGVEAQLRWHAAPSVGRGLHELAEAVSADLLVVGSSHRALLGRVVLGDNTRAALNGAPCAIAIAPAGYWRRPAAVGKFGVGYDGSPESKHALTVARSLAREHGSNLSAFRAVWLPRYMFTGPTPDEDAALENLLAEARAEIAAHGDVEPHVAYGRPAEELARYGDSIDLLVVGSRSYGPGGRLMHGSTSVQLARSCSCPLLVLTRGAREAETTNAGDRDGALTEDSRR